MSWGIVFPGMLPATTCISHILRNLIQDLVSGLDGVMFNDLMENIEWFFNLHDKNKDGYLTKDEVLTLSESFLVSEFRLFLICISGMPI
jgi:hypothetical protein